MAFKAGSIIATIGGDLAPFRSALSRAKGLAGGFASSIGGVIGSPFATIAGGVTAALGAHAVISRISHSMEEIDNSAKAADRLGLTTEAYAGLAHQAGLAGVDIDSLGMSLQHMQKGLVDAVNGTGTAKAALAGLNLDAKELAGLSPEKAMGKIGDALKGVTNPAERASIAMDLFGMRGGPRLLAMISQGTAGMEASQAEAEKLGLTLSRVDAAKVEGANDALTKAGEVVTGIANKVAVGLAPYVQGLADRFVEAATAGGGIGPKVGGAIEWVAKGVAELSDYLNVLDAGWQVLRGVASYALGSVLDVLGLVVGGVEWLYAKVSGGAATHFGDGMQAVAKGLLSVGDEAFAKAGEDWDKFMDRTNAKAVTKAFADMRSASQEMAEGVAADAAKMNGVVQGIGAELTDVQKKVVETLAGIRADVATFGLSDGQKKLFDFKALDGVRPEQVEEFTKLASELDRLNKAKGLADQGK